MITETQLQIFWETKTKCKIPWNTSVRKTSVVNELYKTLTMINFLQNPKSNCYVKGILHFLSVTDSQLFQLLTEGYYDTKRVDTPESYGYCNYWFTTALFQSSLWSLSCLVDQKTVQICSNQGWWVTDGCISSSH